MKFKELLDKLKNTSREEQNSNQDQYALYDEVAVNNIEEIETNSEAEDNTINQDIPTKRAEIIKPRSFSDCAKIADELKLNKMVLIDLSDLENSEKRRIIDFISGVIYINDGIYKKIEGNIYKIIIRK